MSSRDTGSPEGAGSSARPPCEISYLWGNRAHKGTSYHFSEKGILILCSQPVPIKTRIRLQLRIPGVKDILKLEGEVVWTNIHGHADSVSPRGMGVRFVSPDPDQERLLAEAADQYGSARSPYRCYYE